MKVRIQHGIFWKIGIIFWDPSEGEGISHPPLQARSTTVQHLTLHTSDWVFIFSLSQWFPFHELLWPLSLIQSIDIQWGFIVCQASACAFEGKSGSEIDMIHACVEPWLFEGDRYYSKIQVSKNVKCSYWSQEEQLLLLRRGTSYPKSHSLL